MAEPAFPHLTLAFVKEDRASLYGRGEESERTKQARGRPNAHFTHLARQLRERMAEWEAVGGSSVHGGVPLLLEVDDSEDADELCRKLGLELVGEGDDGFLIAALTDLQAIELNRAMDRFAANERGGASVAKLHELRTTEDRLKRTLSPQLLTQWPNLADDIGYTVLVSISAGSLLVAPIEQEEQETDTAYASRLIKWRQSAKSQGRTPPPRKEREPDELFARRLEEWRRTKLKEALRVLEQKRDQREDAFRELVYAHDGEIHEMIDGPPCRPDSLGISETFEVAVTLNGKGLRDLVLNLPGILEVGEQEETSTISVGSLNGDAASPHIRAPAPDAPRVCVIDSGIQERHPLLAAAINISRSHCYVPGRTRTDVADEVPGGGHGTRVAGTILHEPDDGFGDGTPAVCWLENARILDEFNGLSSRVSPPALVNRIADDFAGDTKLFVHAVSGRTVSSTTRMTAWAAAFDDRSHRDGILVVQAAGNAGRSDAGPTWPSVRSAYASGAYPDPLLEDRRFRVPNPAQALHSITVGAVATASWSDLDHATLALPNEPATYTRVGLGIWGSIKPDVVVPVGDFAYPCIGDGDPVLRREACRPIVRKASGAEPLIDADAVGTSFAAPRIARIAAQLAAILPGSPPLLYRALIVQAARWPAAVNSWEPLNILRTLGYGVVDGQRALGNSPHRVTLVTADAKTIRARQAKVFCISVPRSMRDPSNSSAIRIEITMTYTSAVRRKRRNRGYLGVWVDWKASKRNETRAAFEARVFKDGSSEDRRNDTGFRWTIGAKIDQGILGARNNLGTAQKDWADVAVHEMPDEFMIAIVGHPGWDRDPDAVAKFALVVSFESTDQTINVYNDFIEISQLVPASP